MAKSKSKKSAKKGASRGKAQRTAPEEITMIELEVEIVGAHVPIWRKVTIPATDTLAHLHHSIMVMFDWSGSGLYHFKKGAVYYDDPRLIEQRTEPVPKGEKHHDAARYRVSSVLQRIGNAMLYEYEVDDGWLLRVKLCDRLTDDDLVFGFLPVCLAGDGACPPEDVGGVDGYRRFCAAVNDPSHPECQAARDWLGLRPGETFDETKGDFERINLEYAHEIYDSVPDDALPSDPDELRKMVRDLLAECEATRVTMLLLAARLSELERASKGEPRGGDGGAGDGAGAVAGDGTDDDADEGGGAAKPTAAPSASKRSSTAGAPELRVVSGCRGKAPGGASGTSWASASAAASAPAPAPASARPAKYAKKTKTPFSFEDSAVPPMPDISGFEFGDDDSYQLFEQQHDRNDALLKEFEAWLRADGLSEKTVGSHVSNVDSFINLYLIYEEPIPAEDGFSRLDGYFMWFFPRKCLWSSPNSARSSIASIKKFYKYMLEAGRIGDEEYRALLDDIKECKDEWVKASRF